MKNIFLVLVYVNIFVYADYFRTKDIVTDNITGLMWQDNEDTYGIINTRKWQEALEYCEALKFGGYSNWRLPNINELSSLIQDNQRYPLINEKFNNVERQHYWSSTTSADNDYYAWTIFFDSGKNIINDKENNLSIRCVRDRSK